VVSFIPTLFISGERDFGTHYIGTGMGPRTGMNLKNKRKTFAGDKSPISLTVLMDYIDSIFGAEMVEEVVSVKQTEASFFLLPAPYCLFAWMNLPP
jgi:hypothetical protein